MHNGVKYNFLIHNFLNSSILYLLMGKKGFKDRQITGNVGLYFICYKLSRRGWNVLPTSRNARGIDILAYGKEGGQLITIQTKSFTGKHVAIGPFKSKNDILADFYIATCNTYNIPITYILKKDETKSLLTEHKGKYWLEYKDYQKSEFLEKWDKIGFGFSDNYEINQIRKIDREMN